MNHIELMLETEPKDKYQKAMHDLIKADKSISELNSQEMQRLLREFMYYKKIIKIS